MEMPARDRVNVFAHSMPGAPLSEWEPLSEHLQQVGLQAGRRAGYFSDQILAQAAGVLHDIGKTSPEFQHYIAGDGSSVDHSTAGALEALQLYPCEAAMVLAYAIAGHHAGLADGARLRERLSAARGSIPDYSGWEAHASPPEPSAVAACAIPADAPKARGFARAFFMRMLFSCLVDADFVETERFYAKADPQRSVPNRSGFSGIATLADRLAESMSRTTPDDTPVNRLRAEVLAHARGKAAMAPGLFTLTVPTGGGKTLTSLAFALEHARAHGLRRVVYVIPYTSIIEQTAQVFRDALGDADVLEHHASFDWEADLPRAARPAEADAGEGRDGLAKLRRAAENWEAPVVVTTAVQFFESLFANRTSRCRKLHNLAGAVIVLDEAQTLPLPLLRPCLAALDELARNYRASVVLCTATQPAVRVQDGFDGGLHIPPERELAPDPQALYGALRRVAVERREGPTHDAEIATRFADAGQMLCIVNSRAHAHDLFASIRDLPGATHLTTLMCPRHRGRVLAQVRAELKAGKPVRLLATSLIEAGVDISFPEVWRASAGLDAIAQAAGRCNRNDELAEFGRKGKVVVFEPAEHKPPQALVAFQQAAASALRAHSDDPLTLDAVRAYFRQLYWQKGAKGFDAAKLEGQPFPIMDRIAERSGTLMFEFESIARAFRMIDEVMQPVIVPYDDAARETLKRLSVTDRPLAGDLRRLQQYVVPVPHKVRAQWLLDGALVKVHDKLGDTLLAFPDLALYDPQTGVKLSNPMERAAEANVM